jgi:hypothetical protein
MADAEDGKDGEERLFAALQNREQVQGTVSSERSEKICVIAESV